MDTHVSARRPKILWLALAIFCLFCLVSIGVFLWVNMGFDRTIIVSEVLEGQAIRTTESEEAAPAESAAPATVSEAPGWLLTSRWIAIAAAAVAALFTIYLEISHRRAMRVR